VREEEQKRSRHGREGRRGTGMPQTCLRMQGHLVVGRGRSGAADVRRQVNRKEVRLGHEGRVYDSSKLSSKEEETFCPVFVVC
jgi:hypothetical protein